MEKEITKEKSSTVEANKKNSDIMQARVEVFNKVENSNLKSEVKSGLLQVLFNLTQKEANSLV